MHTLNLSVVGQDPITVEVKNVVNAGYAGRDQASVRAHIEELAELGVPAPSTTPTLYPVANYTATTNSHIQVVNDQTSGEMEYVIIFHEGKRYLTIGSDHSDRELEADNVPKAKQICPDFMAAEVWDYDEVKNHFGDIKVRCEVIKDGEKTLYMEGTMADLLGIEDWMDMLAERGLDKDGTIFFSGCWGTIPDSFIYADRYELTMTDDVLGRSIQAAYDVEVLPRGIE